MRVGLIVREAEQRRDLGEIANKAFSLARLKANAYGDCIDGGEPISPFERLSVNLPIGAVGHARRRLKPNLE